VREITKGLPKEIREKLPILVAFAESQDEIIYSWGSCYDEVKAFIASNKIN
jgi:hypothetical protein